MYAYTATARPASIDAKTLVMCRGLGQSDIARIAAMGTYQKLAARRTLFCEGDTAENVYEITKGMLKLFKILPDGRRQVTGFLSAGHLLGIAHDERHLYTAESVTDVVLCRYPRSRFDRLVDEVPGFARRLLAATFDELRAAQDQMLLLGRKGAVEKIASFLVMMADRVDQTGGDELHIPMGRTDIADYLGLTIETVSRTLSQLRRNGVIGLPSPTRVALLDREQLEQLAEGGYVESL